jgi:hypothetical protein
MVLQSMFGDPGRTPSVRDFTSCPSKYNWMGSARANLTLSQHLHGLRLPWQRAPIGVEPPMATNTRMVRQVLSPFKSVALTRAQQYKDSSSSPNQRGIRAHMMSTSVS